MDIAVRNCMWVRIKENHCRRDVISSDPVMVFVYDESSADLWKLSFQSVYPV